MPTQAVAELMSIATHFGAAGLMGWLWLSERRAAAVRERQVDALHERLMQERTHVRALLCAMAESTRALTALEAGQRALAEAVARAAAVPPELRSDLRPAPRGGGETPVHSAR